MNSFADHPKSKFLVDKSIDATNIVLSSRTKYLFQCQKCPHTYECNISNLVGLNRGCPYCCTSSSKLCGCTLCFNKSFASHPKSQYVLDKNIDLMQISQGSKMKLNFKCPHCKHIFNSAVNKIARNKKPSWCPYCSVPTKILCDAKNCQHCLNRSFASHPKSKYIADKTVNPRKIHLASESMYLFNCDKCEHQFEKRVYSITSKNHPVWCPYCVNQKLCDCQDCYNKSFASHPKSKFLADKTIDASKIFKGSKTKYAFKCEDCLSIFSASLSHITNINEPRWCRYCKNKTEKKLYHFLKTVYSNIITEFTAEWCRNILRLRFDICLPDINIIIELDGLQHFEEIRNWGDPVIRTKTDIYKMKCAINNGYSVIRILQDDVCYDRHNWKNVLTNHIKQYEEQCVIFLSNSDIYKKHIDDELLPYCWKLNCGELIKISN
jgi:very-short-patch-repair endonuclease